MVTYMKVDYAQFDMLCFDFLFLLQVGFKMFLGVTASVTNWDAEGTCCNIVLEDNPLVDFVELPDTCHGLYYCNVLSGVIRGALEMVNFYYYVTPHFDMVKGIIGKVSDMVNLTKIFNIIKLSP